MNNLSAPQLLVASSIRKQLETSQSFIAWLNSLDPKTVVGETGDPSKDPIHSFLCSIIPGLVPEKLDVYNTAISYDHYWALETCRTTWWCRFVLRIDRISDVKNSPITVEYCLQVLELMENG